MLICHWCLERCKSAGAACGTNCVTNFVTRFRAQYTHVHTHMLHRLQTFCMITPQTAHRLCLSCIIRAVAAHRLSLSRASPARPAPADGSSRCGAASARWACRLHWLCSAHAQKQKQPQPSCPTTTATSIHSWVDYSLVALRYPLPSQMV